MRDTVPFEPLQELGRGVAVGNVNARASGFDAVDEIVRGYLKAFRIVLVQVADLFVLAEGFKKGEYGIFHASTIPLSSP
jgi:hypothetical protein